MTLAECPHILPPHQQCHTTHIINLSSQSLLDAWRVELARQPLSMTESDACAVLQVQPDGTGHVPEDSLKAAYRRCTGVEVEGAVLGSMS